MPAKFQRCVKAVAKKKIPNVNPYAICRVSTGFYGSTRHSKIKHKVMKGGNK
jgi:hypothetical protein